MREMTGTPSSRRATATAGCAGSRHIFGQAETETAEQMAGSHGRSKIGRNGEYRPDRKYRPPVHPSGWCCAGPSTRALLLPAIPTAASHHRVPFYCVIAPASPACARHHCHSDCSVFVCAQAQLLATAASSIHEPALASQHLLATYLWVYDRYAAP